MEQLEKFQIIFNNPSAIYNAGDTVYGYGWAVFKEPLHVQTVCMEAIGEARVEWMSSSDIQASDEEVFNYTTVLPIKGEDKNSQGATLHEGSHYFPFEFTLPSHLPSSFKGKHGRLRYFVRMTICTSGGPHPTRTSKFGVQGSLDLNGEPNAALSVENDTFEPLGSWCCISGTVTAKLRLEKKGYTVKESVPVCAEIKNLSSRRISSTSVSLIQLICSLSDYVDCVFNAYHAIHYDCVMEEFGNVTYYSYRGRFSETTKLVTVHKGGVGPRGKQTWQKELLSIPTTPPSHLHGCKIIDIQYCIELAIKPSGFGRKVKIPVDITIGTVPIQEPQTQKTSYHPLPSIVKDDVIPFPFFELGGSPSQLISQYMLPTAPPWEEDDDIP